MSPIKGLSDKRRFPRIGKIRTGEKRVSERTGSEYPAALDHFKFDSESEKINAVARKMYGDQPKDLEVVFVSDDLEQVFSQWYKRYRKSIGRVCKGDGQTADEVQEDGSMKERACPCEKFECKECRMVASLMFMLPNFPVLGVWQIDTSSVNAIININSTLNLVKEHLGRLTKVKFRLSLRPQDAQVEGKKKKIHVLHLHALASGASPGPVLPTASEDALLIGNGEPDPEEFATDSEGRAISKKTGRPI